MRLPSRIFHNWTENGGSDGKEFSDVLCDASVKLRAAG